MNAVWVLTYTLDYGGDEFQSEVVGVFDSAESAQVSVLGAYRRAAVAR